MTDGLFHQRPSVPRRIDVAETVRAVIAREGWPMTASWAVEDQEAPWPTVHVWGQSYDPDGAPRPWDIRRRVPGTDVLTQDGSERPACEVAIERLLVAMLQVKAAAERDGAVFPAFAPEVVHV